MDSEKDGADDARIEVPVVDRPAFGRRLLRKARQMHSYVTVRLRRSSIAVRLVPLLHLTEQEDDDGLWEFQAEGDDPQFRVDPVRGIESLVPGWYVVSVRLDPREGRILQPCLYPDYGAGCSEGTRIPLPQPDQRGMVTSLVVITHPLRAMRFDPSIRKVRFRLGPMVFRRVHRAGALLRLLTKNEETEDQDTSSGGIGPRLRRFVKKAGREGFSRAADELVVRYYNTQGLASGDYQDWLEKHGSASIPHLSNEHRCERTDSECTNLPLVSVVLPVFNPSVELLTRCIESVRAQTWARWQLCIADDASHDPAIIECIKDFVRQDPRIEAVFRESNGHISEATNSALGLARGSHVAFLDHDDELDPDALRQVVLAMSEYPNARLFYTDEDKIEKGGRRFDPHFKPAWNPELLRSQNYICHLMVVEATLLASVGGVRVGFEGSQDHDLALRCTEILAPEQICHIPKILYHWRAIEGSTSIGGEQKAYASEAGQKAVQEHLQRMGIEGTVDVVHHGCYRSRLALPTSIPKVSIVVPTRDRADLLSRCVDSILNITDYPDYEVIVVDNGSEDPDAKALLSSLRSEPRIKVIEYCVPFNFSTIVNHGVQHATGELLCLLNNDTEVIAASWLRDMAATAVIPGNGAVGAMLYYPDETVQHAGVVLGLGGVAGHIMSRMERGLSGYMARGWVAQNMSAVTAACLMVRKSLYEDVQGFDEELAVAFNDIDFCLRLLERGYRNVWLPHVELYHHESASRGEEDSPEKLRRFNAEVQEMMSRWGHLLDDDPAYNPNLALDQGMYNLAFPPRSPKPRVGIIPNKTPV